MKVDELNNIEEVPVEEVSQESSSENIKEELSEEDKKRAFEFFVEKGKKDYARYIRDIQKYISDKKITVSKAIEEAQNSKSGLTLSRRQFLLAISPDVWNLWIPEKKPIKQVDYGESNTSN